jgi:hypothetical protein
MEQENNNQLTTPAVSDPEIIEVLCAAGCGTAVKVTGYRVFNKTLKPRQFCDVCTERARRRKDEWIERAREARLAAMWDAICPPLYQDTDESRLPSEPFGKVMAWEYGAAGLLLVGGSGLGKTRCIYRLLYRLLQEERSIRAFDATKFAHDCARHFGDGSGERWISELCAVDAVLLDDLGKAKMTERVEAELFGLVEKRAANFKPLLVTTNFTGQLLLQKLSEGTGPALVRRLRDFCITINFGAEKNGEAAHARP